MITATLNLENDHVHILKLTDIMVSMARSSCSEAGDMEKVINIIKNYADGIHHAKEEKLLFPLLAERGLSMQQGPVAVMMHEHVEGRAFVKGMRDNLDMFISGNKEAIVRVHENMLGYAGLLQNHISKENNVLFRMADRMLSGTDQDKLLAKFSGVEEGCREGERPGDFIALVEQLAAIYLKD
ncbi:MAG: hemerythrin domain-containing protein [Bacteroidales bacterium]